MIEKSPNVSLRCEYCEKITDFEQVRAGLVMDLFNFRSTFEKDEKTAAQKQLFDTKIDTKNITKEIEKWLKNSNFQTITENNFLKIYELCKKDIRASELEMRRGILEEMV